MKRSLATSEFLLGAAIVLGHNVWHVIPNEILILIALAILSMRLRAASWNWSLLGFRRPESWRFILLVALGAAALRIVLSDFVIDPLTSTYWPEARLPEGADQIAGNMATQ